MVWCSVASHSLQKNRFFSKKSGISVIWELFSTGVWLEKSKQGQMCSICWLLMIITIFNYLTNCYYELSVSDFSSFLLLWGLPGKQIRKRVEQCTNCAMLWFVHIILNFGWEYCKKTTANLSEQGKSAF